MGLFNNTNNDAAGNTRKGGGLRNLYKMAKPALNLSADQETKVEAILGQLKEDRVNIKSNGDAGNKEELRSARQQARQQIMEVLNPEQQKIWKDNVDAWKEQAEGPMK